MAPADPEFIAYRKPKKPARAVIYIHGFTGDAGTTWGKFPLLLAADPELADCDVYSWGYPSKLNLAYVVTKYFWTDDPDINTLGRGLRTVLENAAQDYKKLVLVGHSMGGLVIQSFVIEELLRKKSEQLGRVTEIVLYGTPSGGLRKASLGAFLKNQIEDMSAFGPFVQKLRSEWKRLIDDQRSNPLPGAGFRLTLVAGMKDTFVPQESSLDPFPFDEKELVPGDHTEMVKPASEGDLAYLVLKRRLLRGTPSEEERALIQGQSEVAVLNMNRLKAAAELGDVDELVAMAGELTEKPSRMPRVERELGLALSAYEQYQQAVALLSRYLNFKMPGTGEPPFRSDAQAVQQLAVAMSGAGDHTGAVARLNQLDPQIRNQSETLGIEAGRIKRMWLKKPYNVSLGHRALNTYRTGFELAKTASDVDQIIYNGINTAYMSFALGEAGYEEIAKQVLASCDSKTTPDYWTDATRGEAHLLLGEYGLAAQAYDTAVTHAPVPRHLATTGQQAREILTRRGNPPGSQVVAKLLDEKFSFINLAMDALS